MLDPIEKTARIATTPKRAFELFYSRIAEWWPLDTHSLSLAKGRPAATVQFEPFEGGRLYETSPDGDIHIWGTVTVWKPGEQLSFTWHVGRSPEQATQVDIAFERDDMSGTRVILTHSNWHVLGEDAKQSRAGYIPGWDQVFIDGYEAFATREANIVT